MGELPRKQKREPKMCNPQQQNPPQNAAWQGVYPDLSALNQLFSTQQATAADAGQPSPWINFLASLGLQPIPGGQTPQQQQQARPEQEQLSAPPAPETERHEGHTYAGANSAAWRQPQHQASPGASQQPRDYSCGYSCGAPHISQLHPVCALFLLLPCLHKLHVRGQPLGDPVSWGVRFTGSNTAW